MRMAFEIDVRGVAPSIAVPTLIRPLRATTRCATSSMRRWLAREHRRARATSSSTASTTPLGATGRDQIVAEIEEFLTGARGATRPDMVLATVLFTDIVGSTEHAAAARRPALARAPRAATTTRCVRELARFHGRELDTAGDGFLASFDGPGRAIGCARAAIDAIGDARPRAPRRRAHRRVSRCWTASSAVSPFTSAHGSPRKRSRARCSCRRRSRDLVAGSGIGFGDRGMHGAEGRARRVAPVLSRPVARRRPRRKRRCDGRRRPRSSRATSAPCCGTA